MSLLTPGGWTRRPSEVPSNPKPFCDSIISLTNSLKFAATSRKGGKEFRVALPVNFDFKSKEKPLCLLAQRALPQNPSQKNPSVPVALIPFMAGSTHAQEAEDNERWNNGFGTGQARYCWEKLLSSIFIHQLWAEWPTTCGDLHKDFRGIWGNICDLNGDKSPSPGTELGQKEGSGCAECP